MDRPQRPIRAIQDANFIEENTILNLPPPPIIYEFGVEECYVHSRGRYKPHATYPPKKKSCITVKSVTLFIIAACVIGFIVFSPLLHYFL